MYRYRKKREPGAQERARDLREELRGRLVQAAGGHLSGADPVASVPGYFRQTFDQAGRARTEERLSRRHAPAGEEPQARQGAAETPGGTAGGLMEPRRGAAGARAEPQSGAPENTRTALRSFSDVAFQRGNLAGSLLQGTGQMMLVSCLRRSMNPRRPEPHSTFPWAEKALPFSGSDPDRMVFTRDLARGAVSIVVDTLHDAHRTLDLLGKQVREGGPGAEELYAMYPFLDDRREREMLRSYRELLPLCADPGERGAVQNALVRTQAMIEAKDRARQAFLTTLREVSDRARDAMAEVESPEFTERIVREVLEPEIPPEDGEDGAGAPPNPPDREGDGGLDGTQWSEPETDNDSGLFSEDTAGDEPDFAGY